MKTLTTERVSFAQLAATHCTPAEIKLLKYGAFVPSQVKECRRLVALGYMKEEGGCFVPTPKGFEELELSRCAAGQVRHYDTSELLVPAATSPAIKLTKDEKHRDCQLFHIPARVAGLDTDVVAVCEPAAPWQWLPLGALLLANIYEESADSLEPVGKQLRSRLATNVVRLLDINHEAGQVTVANQNGENSKECYDVSDLRELWTVSRVAATRAA